MKTLVIPINWKCFSKCIFCQFKRFTGENEILFQELEKYKQEYNIWGYTSVMITDGEPLNHEFILEIISFILSFSDCLIIDTNGEKFSNRSFLREFYKIIDWYKVVIKIPIYWSREHIHNVISQWNYKKLIKWLIYLKYFTEIKVQLHCLVLKQNYKDLWNIQQFVHKIGYKVDFIYTIPDGYIDIQKILVSFSQIYKYTDLSIKNIPVCIKKEGVNIKISDNKATLLWWKLKKFQADFSSNRLEKVYVDKCHSCKNKKNCAGIYTQYLNIFWNTEFL